MIIMSHYFEYFVGVPSKILQSKHTTALRYFDKTFQTCTQRKSLSTPCVLKALLKRPVEYFNGTISMCCALNEIRIDRTKFVGYFCLTSPSESFYIVFRLPNKKLYDRFRFHYYLEHTSKTAKQANVNQAEYQRTHTVFRCKCSSRWCYFISGRHFNKYFALDL